MFAQNYPPTSANSTFPFCRKVTKTDPLPEGEPPNRSKHPPYKPGNPRMTLFVKFDKTGTLQTRKTRLRKSESLFCHFLTSWLSDFDRPWQGCDNFDRLSHFVHTCMCKLLEHLHVLGCKTWQHTAPLHNMQWHVEQTAVYASYNNRLYATMATQQMFV